jgi:phosphate starvation-inducible PhoH-like protein
MVVNENIFDDDNVVCDEFNAFYDKEPEQKKPAKKPRKEKQIKTTLSSSKNKSKKQNEKQILNEYNYDKNVVFEDIKSLENSFCDNFTPFVYEKPPNDDAEHSAEEIDVNKMIRMEMNKSVTNHETEIHKKNTPSKRRNKNATTTTATATATTTGTRDKKYTKPKNPNQEKYFEMLKDKNKKIIFATGPAGTGKTVLATEQGIHYFLSKVYDKLIFTRPSVSVDEEIGFLPGTLEEKMAPWIRPIYDVLYNFLSVKEVEYLMQEKIIEIVPLGFMRGRTFKNSFIVADEMQNSTVNQMKMLLTRLGENSRLVVTGDLEQHDRLYEKNGLKDFLEKLSKHESNLICSIDFERKDILRENVVKEVLDIYEKNARIE